MNQPHSPFTSSVQQLIDLSRKISDKIQRNEFVMIADIQTIAAASLNIPQSDRFLVYEYVWNNTFIESIMMYVDKRKDFWNYLFVGIGNSIAYPSREFVYRVIAIPCFTLFLLDSIETIDILTTTDRDNRTRLELSIWVVANILQSLEGETPQILYRIIPKLVKILHNILEGQDPIKKFQFTSNSESIRADQVKLRIFRSLCAIFSKVNLRECFPTEYTLFLQIVRSYSSFIQALLYEYTLGLEGKRIEAINFYPEAYHRALTVLFLTQMNSEMKDLLVQNGIIPILLRSLYTKFLDADLPTSLLWSRTIQSLYNIVSNVSYHPFIKQDPHFSSINYAATYRIELPIIGLNERKLAAEMVVILRIHWEIERLFWIAQMKPTDHCDLSRLPAVLIKPILVWYVLFDACDRYEMNCIRTYNGYNKRK